MTEIFDLAHKALEYTAYAGADEVEIFCIKGRSITVDIQKNEIDLAKESLLSGIGIRAIVNGAVGFSSTNDHGRVKEACVLCCEISKSKGQRSCVVRASEEKKVPGSQGTFDKKIADIEIEACIDHAIDMVRGASSSRLFFPLQDIFLQQAQLN